MILRIADWDRVFENAASRKLKRLDWVPIPIKTDGEGYTFLVDHPNAAAHLGAWYAIVEAAAKQDPRGNLPGGIPRDIGGICRSLGRMSRLPGEIFQEVIPRLLAIGWIEQVQSNQQYNPKVADSASVVADSANASAENGATGKGREGNYKTHTQRRACALDLKDSTSQRFEEWFSIWEKIRGNGRRQQSAQAFLSVATVENESDVFACTSSYLEGPGSKADHGFHPDNFLFEMAKESFKTRWPSPNGKSQTAPAPIDPKMIVPFDLSKLRRQTQ